MSTTFIITERSVVAWGYWGGGGMREEIYRTKRKHLRVTDLLTNLIAVTDSQLYTLSQNLSNYTL